MQRYYSFIQTILPNRLNNGPFGNLLFINNHFLTGMFIFYIFAHMDIITKLLQLINAVRIV